MGRSKTPLEPNVNFEPLGGSRASSSNSNSESTHMEQDNKDHPLPRSQTSVHQSSRPARPRSRSPRYSSHYSPRSTRRHGSRPRSRSPTDRSRRLFRPLSLKMASSRSYRSRSPPHKVAPRDRGVANSDYYRPSYAVRSASKSPESKGQAPSVVSAHNLGESLDDEETPGTKCWAELASCKHREWTAPATSSPYSDLPSPIEESWAEMASRKHKEVMAMEASKATALAKVTPATPANSRDARSFLGNRTRLREIKGLDIQRQVSSLIYPRKVKAGALPVKPKVGITMEASQKAVGSSSLAELSPQHSRVYSREPKSALEQGMHASKQSLLSSSPLQDSPENSYITAEPHGPISPPKVQVNTETLRSRIQELRRRASFASEKPRPIRSIMDEPFLDDDDFESEPNDFEPVVPTHWQD